MPSFHFRLTTATTTTTLKQTHTTDIHAIRHFGHLVTENIVKKICCMQIKIYF